MAEVWRGPCYMVFMVFPDTMRRRERAIVLARIDETEDLEIVRQLLRAHEYWRMKQLSSDLVVINEKSSSYAQELQGSLEELVRGSRLRR